MKTKVQNQEQVPQRPVSAPVVNLFQSRPFAVQTQPESSSFAPQETTEWQAQLANAERFGHNFSRVQVQADTPARLQPKWGIEHSEEQHPEDGNPIIEPAKFMAPPSIGNRIQPEVDQEESMQMKPIQLKLAIGAPGDKYEQEAYQMATQVMRMPAPASQQLIQPEEMPDEDVQRLPSLQQSANLGSHELKAHELTHVVQQNSVSRLATQIQKQPAQPAISTPLGKGVKFAKDGSAELKAGSVEVVVLPDKEGETLSSEEASAETEFNLEGGDAPGCEFNEKGKVTKIDAIPPIKVTIQTTYRTGVSPSSQSAYGKGTTKEDIKAGNTSLRDHEGSHGSDYINYLKAHPIPTFKGKKGMTEEQFNKAQENYLKALENYKKAMDDYSEAHTDCVGTKGNFCK